jgi:hypothetical protein
MELQCSNPECGAPLARFGGRIRPVMLKASSSVLFLWTCAGCVAHEAFAAMRFSRRTPSASCTLKAKPRTLATEMLRWLKQTAS